MMLAHRRSSRLLGLVLCVVWIAALAQADTAVTPAMRCQRHMPCCPQGGNGESCPTARCPDQVPEKAEAQVERARENEGPRATPTIREGAARRSGTEPVRELTAGLQFQAGVFRLKDDLWI
jgi:hypothetical protein